MFKRTFRRFIFWAAVLALLVYTIKQFPDRGIEAETAYQAGDYVTAAKFWAKMASLDDAAAQYNLGALYASGNGVPASETAAHELFTTAAESGNSAAMFELGKTYETGAGVAPSMSTAFLWIKNSAEAGYAPAQIDLGLKYLNGTGVEKDIIAANFWLSRAAGAGSAPPVLLLTASAPPCGDV